MSQLHQDHNEGSPAGWMYLPTPLQRRLRQPQTATRKRDQSMDESIYKRFIDDILEIWLPHPNQKINSQLWEEFTSSMNNYPGLTWEFNIPTNKVDFMDLTISITNGNISTSLFGKPLNLHLYIPPDYAHQPGLFPGIVHSTLFRIFTLCSDHNDRILRTKVFFQKTQSSWL